MRVAALKVCVPQENSKIAENFQFHFAQCFKTNITTGKDWLVAFT